MKPIILSKGTKTKFKYKYCRTAYAGEIELKFMTDLDEDQFDGLFDGSYTIEQIDRFEETGRFEEFEKNKIIPTTI